MPTYLTEGAYTFAFIVGEKETIQVDSIVLANGQNLPVGAILAKTFVGTGAYAMVAGSTGNPTCGAITVGTKAESGEYTIVFYDATHYNVYSPGGGYLGSGVLGTAFVGSNRVTFTLTAGGSAAIAGDSAVIMITEGASTYKAASGSDAAAILGPATDESGGATTTTALTRLAEFNQNLVDYNTMDAAHKAAANAALARRNLIARGGF